MSESPNPPGRGRAARLIGAALILAAAACLGLAGIVYARVLRWQFADDGASFEKTAAACLADCESELESPSRRLDLFRECRVTIRAPGGVTLAIRAHEETPLARRGDTLFWTVHCAISTGASVVATDLRSGRQLYETPLEGIGPTAHSKYRNRMNLEVLGPFLIARGDESNGRYVEVLWAATGRRVWSRAILGWQR